MVHKIGEPEPNFVVRVAVGGEKERVAGNGSGDFAAAGEPELAIEFAGIVKAEHLFGLFGEEIFCFREESEGGVAVEKGFEVGYFIGVRRDGSGARRFRFGAFGSQFLGYFGFEERGGEGARIWEFRVSA